MPKPFDSIHYSWLLPMAILLLFSVILLQFVDSQPLIRSEWTTHLVSFGRAEQMAAEKNTYLNRAVFPKALKKYYTPRENLDFSNIADDLKKTDIHPPLYFWLLHPIIHYTGINESSARTLNIVLFFVAGMFFYKLSCMVFHKKSFALTALILWAASVPMVLLVMKARPYMLATTLTVIATTYLFYLLPLKKIQIHQFLLYGLILTVGFLTLYQFFLVALALSFIIFIHYIKNNKKRILYFCLTTVASVTLFYTVFPALFVHMERVANHRRHSDIFTIQERLLRIMSAFSEYFSYHLTWLIVFFVIGTAFLLLFKKSVFRKNIFIELGQPYRRFQLYFIVLAVLVTGFLAIWFLTGRAPHVLMTSTKRIGFIFPAILIASIAILDLLITHEKFKTALLILWVFLSIHATNQYLTKMGKPPYVPENVVQQHSLVILNHKHREIFPEIIFSMNDQAQFFMTRNQNSLEKKINSLIPLIKKQKNALLILMIRPYNTKMCQRINDFVETLSSRAILRPQKTSKEWLLAYEVEMDSLK